MNDNDFISKIVPVDLIQPELKKYINHISFNETICQIDNETKILSLPDGMCELVIVLENSYYRTNEINNSKFSLIKNSHLVGFSTSKVYLIPKPNVQAISIRFNPGCLSAFKLGNMEEFTNKTIDAKELFGNDFISLEEKLYNTKSIHLKINLIQKFLVSRLFTDVNHNKFIDLIKNEYLQKNSFELKTNADYKKSERLFKKYMGTTPKTFQQIVKFNYATKLIKEFSKPNLTQVAYLSDYHDQSHFVKKFKEYSGMTPLQYYKTNSELIAFNQHIINNLF